jgi:hypothetical protein
MSRAASSRATPATTPARPPTRAPRETPTTAVRSRRGPRTPRLRQVRPALPAGIRCPHGLRRLNPRPFPKRPADSPTSVPPIPRDRPIRVPRSVNTLSRRLPPHPVRNHRGGRPRSSRPARRSISRRPAVRARVRTPTVPPSRCTGRVRSRSLRRLRRQVRRRWSVESAGHVRPRGPGREGPRRARTCRARHRARRTCRSRGSSHGR